MNLRPIITQDLPALAAIHAESFDRPWPADALWDLIARPGALALLAAEDGGSALLAPPIGFILCWRVADEAELLTLAVAERARNRGVGALLLEAAVRGCAASGCDSLWLEVAEDNIAARALYQSSGFRESGRRPGYYRRPAPAPPADALVLRRRLTQAGGDLIVI